MWRARTQTASRPDYLQGVALQGLALYDDHIDWWGQQRIARLGPEEVRLKSSANPVLRLIK